MTLNNSIDAFCRTYIHPFKELDRTLTLLGGFLGVFGFFLLNTTASYSLGNSGYGDLVSYFGPALIVSGLIYWPVLYGGYSVYDGKYWRLFLLLLQSLALTFFLTAPATPLYQGIAAGIMFSPFWCAYHVAMVQNTTDDNRGFEITLSHFINAMATVGGAICSGIMLHEYNTNLAVIIALISLTLGTLCLSIATKVITQHHSFKNYVTECKKIAHDHPFIARRIISRSLFEIPTFTIAALMYVMGLSPIEMATVLSARVVTLTFLSPLIGHIAHKHRKHSFAIGLTINGAAWFILAINPTLHLCYFITLILIGVGNSFESSGMMTGIYEMQKYASMMWTEFYLGIGRFLGIALLLPLLFINPLIYILTIGFLCGIVYILNRYWQKKYIDGSIF